SRADLSRAVHKLVAALQPLREVEPNLFVLNPLAIPFHGNAAVRALNRFLLRLQVKRALRHLRFQRTINWVFNPVAAILAGELDEALLIYYCVDEYTAFRGVAGPSLAELEARLLRRADAVFVSSERLLQSKSRLNPHAVLVRHGVDYTHFRRALDPQL